LPTGNVGKGLGEGETVISVRPNCASCHTLITRALGADGREIGSLPEQTPYQEWLHSDYVLERYHDELDVKAEPAELPAAAQRTVDYLQSQAARIAIYEPVVANNQLSVQVSVQNLAGHKLPTVFPSRRAWVHLIVTDREGRTVMPNASVLATTVNGDSPRPR
jgi:hypothetical protein